MKDEVDFRGLEAAITLLVEKGSFDSLSAKEKATTLPQLGKLLKLMQQNPEILQRICNPEHVALVEGTFCGAVVKILFQLNASPETMSVLAGFLLGVVYEFAKDHPESADEERLMFAEQRGRALWASRSSPA